METLAVSPEWAHSVNTSIRAGMFNPISPPNVGDIVGAGFETVRAGGGAYARSKDTGVAVVSISGPMTKGGGIFSSLFGGTDTVDARAAVSAAAADGKVPGMMILADSPGGSVAGTQELGDAVRAAAARKPVYTHIDDTGASAMYWVASQSNRITVNRTGAVGSIGVYMQLYDFSKAMEHDKVELVTISSGKFKGIGAHGAKITDEVRAELQRRIDALHEEFVAAVANGRGMSTEQVRELADGRVWTGQEAVDIGLADAVMNFGESLSELVSVIYKNNRRRKIMGSAADLDIL